MDTDGVELKRKGDVDVNARIILVPDFNPQKYKLSPALAEIVSPPLAAKPHILNELWNYVKVSKRIIVVLSREWPNAMNSFTNYTINKTSE